MNYIPVMLNVTGRDVVIFGGGRAAFKKAKNLAPHCVSITAVASRFSRDISELSLKRVKVKIAGISQVEDFLRSDAVVIIATDDTGLNDALERACRERGLLFNRVDRRDSPFIFPSSFDVNGVVVSVSTRGKSPSLSRFLGEVLRKDVESYALALPVLERLRGSVAIKGLDGRAKFFHSLLSEPKFWDLISEGRNEDAYRHGMRLSRKKTRGKGEGGASSLQHLKWRRKKK